MEVEGGIINRVLNEMIIVNLISSDISQLITGISR